MKTSCRLYIEGFDPHYNLSPKDLEEYFAQAKLMSKFISGEVELYIVGDIYYFDNGEMIELVDDPIGDFVARWGGIIGIAIMGLIMFLAAWFG
jgi:hypothetical protein